MSCVGCVAEVVEGEGDGAEGGGGEEGGEGGGEEGRGREEAAIMSSAGGGWGVQVQVFLVISWCLNPISRPKN